MLTPKQQSRRQVIRSCLSLIENCMFYNITSLFHLSEKVFTPDQMYKHYAWIEDQGRKNPYKYQYNWLRWMNIRWYIKNNTEFSETTSFWFMKKALLKELKELNRLKNGRK